MGRIPKQKGRAVRYNRHYEVPAGNDKRWEKWAAPVEQFLSEERDWLTIIAWAKTNKIGLDFLREVLAWLSLQGKAESIKRGSLEAGDLTVHWKATQTVSIKPRTESKPRCPSCSGYLHMEDQENWKCVHCGKRFGRR
jgi:hypothetical protein